MNKTTHFVKNHSFKSALSATTVALALLLSSADATAYDLQANTIYANATGGIYKIDLTTTTATKVADTNASISRIQDIAFDGTTLYGVNLHWQLLKLEPSQTETVAVNEASSFSLRFKGLEARNGVLYGAELRSLVTLDQQTADTGSLGPGASSYGLGAGEEITDLAFANDGTLYATVVFPGISFTFLGIIDTATGALNLIGNTGAEAITALTVKDDVIYAMNVAGDLLTLNAVSGFSTEVAAAVLPGVRGMDTSPVNISGTGSSSGSGEGESSSGSLSAYGLFFIVLLVGARRLFIKML